MRALITGGSRGLGRAIGEALARGGAKVAFTWSRDDGAAEEARAALEALGAEPRLHKGDVADVAHARAVISDLVAAWGGIDVLVNAAGVHQVLPIALIEEEDWDRVLDSHLKGAYVFSRAALRPMIRAKGGVILNIGTFSSERTIEAPIHYAAAKAGLRGLTEAMAREVGRYGIRVVLLAPGLLDEGLSRMLPQYRLDRYLAQCPLGRLGTLDELAAFAAFLVSPDAALITGGRVVVDGGL